MTKQIKIIAIGGGEIGRPVDFKDPSKGRYPLETKAIDEEIIRLTGKKNPRALLLPTASGDHPGYLETFERYYGKILGCEVDALYLKKKSPSPEQIREKILGSDIIYVGGGNTLKMMKLWRKLGVDKVLKEAFKEGKVLCGVSAGAICWFNYGQSDSWKSVNPKNPYIRVVGLGLISGLHAPHFTREPERHSNLKSIMKRTSGVAIALEDCAALEVVDGKYRVISSKPEAKAYRCYWKYGKYHQEIIPQLKEFSDLEELLKK
jgi:dipeptidase E